MDPSSIVKLLEEEEDESMHLKDHVEAFLESLNREIEGKNHSSIQQLATGSYGIGDANNNLHILDDIQAEEQQCSVLSNPSQELKRENEYHLQQNLPQVHLQPGKFWENPSHVPQASNMQSQNNPISNEPERPQPQSTKQQKMSSQRAHGAEQPVDPVNHGPKKVRICELIRILMPLVDKDRRMQLQNLYYQVKRKETTKEGFLRRVKDVVGDQMTKLALSKLPCLQQGNVGIKVPERPNHERESFTSAEISVEESDPRGVHVNLLPSTSSGTLSSSVKLHDLQRSHMEKNQCVGSNGVAGATNSGINMTTVPNCERPTSVNVPSRVQGGPISHFQNNSSSPLYTAPWEGSVTSDQTVGPLSPVVHAKQKPINQSFELAEKPCYLVQQDVSKVVVKQNNGNLRRSNADLEKESSKMVLSTSTTHASLVSPSKTTLLDSSTMVKFPAPSGTVPAGANVKTTPKLPFVGQKKPLEALGSSPSPTSKKQKLCETSSDRSIEQFNDVTALSGINLMEEERKSLCSGAKEDGQASEASRRFVHEEEERTILQKVPLQRKLAEIIATGGLKHINDDVERCLSLCVEERMRGLLSIIIRTSKQRSEGEKCRDRTCITSDIRKQINEMNQKVKEEWEKKHGGEEKLKNEENDTAKENNRSEQVEANKNEDRAKAANVAVHTAVGGNHAFLKWKLMAEARQKPSSGPGRYSKKPSAGGRKFGKNQGSPKVVRSVSAKDVIAVVEKESRMSRSSLLYRLYNRICPDVRTQEKRKEVHIN